MGAIIVLLLPVAIILIGVAWGVDHHDDAATDGADDDGYATLDDEDDPFGEPLYWS